MESTACGAVEFALSCSGRESPPEADLLESLLSKATAVLGREGEAGRPRSATGLPGGLVRIPGTRTIIVPDLHARPRLILDLLRSRLPDGSQVAEALALETLSVLCLGDILHSEGQEAATRWRRATDRLIRSPDVEGLLGPEMEREMTLSLSTLLEVGYLQTVFPGRFRCLKGNHDNMGNHATEGDSPFGKYSHEGFMGAEWFRTWYGTHILGLIREYELLLPIVASGPGFCASHAEPAFAIGTQDLLEYRSRPDIVRALIWTRDGEAKADSVAASLVAILGSPEAAGRGFWIAGHRALTESWYLRTSDGFLQIHAPGRNQVLLIEGGQGPYDAEISLHSVGPSSSLTGGVRIPSRS